jgi:hypothetical protein
MSCRKSPLALFAIRRLERWILSWFKYIESEKELFVSIKHFEKFLEENTKLIGDVCSENIVALKEKIISKRKNF